MSAFYVDTHCHLDLFDNIQVNANAENALGIKTISVTNAPSFFLPNKQLFSNHDNIRIALGIHPQLADKYYSEIKLFEDLISETKYVGEIGLDGSSEYKSSFTLQKSIFEKILKIILCGSPKVLTIHSRNASEETIEILIKYLATSKNKVILHWYSGGIKDLNIAIKNNFYFSVNHKMSASEKGKSIIENIPQRLLLTETDMPFTKEYNVKNRIESLNISINNIANIKGISFEEAKNFISQNFIDIIQNS